MPKLVLIKHALPEIQRGVAPARWPLSAAGRLAAVALAEDLRTVSLSHVFASTEPKASETGRLLAQALGLQFEVREGLHEQRRDSEPFEPDRSSFETKVRSVFERPSERVYGEESGADALARFTAAVEGIVAAHSDEDIAILAHGTVISFFVAATCGVDGFELWRSLETPSLVVVRLPAPS